ncbi:hypothetical protein STAQ_27820 [Allostella sp. ATCC 35155]|nr:hypothetical protein STAQ_27820 [Stella sp. ATCC 35155]
MRNTNRPIEGASCRTPEVAGRWHIVHTNANAERLAAELLMEAGITVHYPHYEVRRRHGRRTVERMAPLYPRYLFAALRPGQAVYDVNHTIGVATVVCRGPQPIEVPTEVMQAEVERTDENGRLTMDELRRLGLALPGKYEHRLRVGQRVRMARGPFEGLAGVVAQLDKRDAIRIWLDVLGREVPVVAVEDDVDQHPG